MRLGKYRHFKGMEYEVVGTVRHSETVEEMVLYKALYKSDDFPVGQLWVRPKEMFMEDVTRDGKTFPRFSYIGDE